MSANTRDLIRVYTLKLEQDKNKQRLLEEQHQNSIISEGVSAVGGGLILGLAAATSALPIISVPLAWIGIGLEASTSVDATKEIILNVKKKEELGKDVKEDEEKLKNLKIELEKEEENKN